MSEKSLVTTAYELMSEAYDRGDRAPKPFLELCSEICDRLGLSEEEFTRLVSRFYTDLTLDGRFVIKENNTWTLREHEKYKDVHIDMNDVYSMDEEDLEEVKKLEEDDEEIEGEEEEKEDSNYEEDDSIVTDDDDSDENN